MSDEPPDSAGHAPGSHRAGLASLHFLPMATTFWPNADHWSVDIPLVTPHPRLDVMAPRGVVVLQDAPHTAPESEYLALEYMDWKSGGDTNFAPIATADGNLDCRGFWNKGDERPDKGARFTSNADTCPTLQRYVDGRRRRLRPCARDQARAPGPRHRVPQLPPRRQQPVQPRGPGLGRAFVARADRQPRQLHAADGHRRPTVSRIRPPRCASRCTAARSSSSTRSGCGTSSCTTVTRRATR